MGFTMRILSACGKQQDLVNIESTNVDGKRGIVWEDRTYIIFSTFNPKTFWEYLQSREKYVNITYI